jgi:hypothetical protein
MMDIDLDTLTLAALLTTAGALGLATIVTGLTSLLGRLFAFEGNEVRVAAVLTFGFVLVLTVQAVMSQAMELGVPLLLAAVLAWYSVTRLAMSIHDDATNQPRSLRNQSDTP